MKNLRAQPNLRLILLRSRKSILLLTRVVCEKNILLNGNVFSVKDAPPTPSQVPAEPVKPSRLKAGGYNGDRYLICFLNYDRIEMRSKLKMKLRFLLYYYFSFLFLRIKFLINFWGGLIYYYTLPPQILSAFIYYIQISFFGVFFL